MARKPDVLCAGGCGRKLYGGKGALPAGLRTCHACRAVRRAEREALAGPRRHTPGPPRRWPNCEICGLPFRPRSNHGVRQRTCSRVCGTKLQALNRGVVRKRPKVSPRVATCTRCGVEFQGRSGQLYCSVLCRERVDKTVRECRHCGESFVPYGKRSRYCSTKCYRKAHRRAGNLRRWRAKDRFGHFTKTDIAERDQWQCHLCGGVVTRSDWSLDHLVPVSRGGEHSRDNVALAHLRCNVSRGAKLLPTKQLRLVG